MFGRLKGFHRWRRFRPIPREKNGWQLLMLFFVGHAVTQSQVGSGDGHDWSSSQALVLHKLLHTEDATEC